jgi:hypothetical protein
MKILFKTFLLCVLTVIVLVGCTNGNDNMRNEIKELKSQNLLMKADIEQLQKENTRLKIEMASEDQGTKKVYSQVEMIEVHDFTDEIIDKVQTEVKENEWVTSNFNLNGKTYVLLGTPKQRKKMRIDIDGFKINEDEITIYYQTFDYHEELIGLKTHLLYEFNGEYKIEFLKTYSTEQ